MDEVEESSDQFKKKLKAMKIFIVLLVVVGSMTDVISGTQLFSSPYYVHVICRVLVMTLPCSLSV